MQNSCLAPHSMQSRRATWTLTPRWKARQLLCPFPSGWIPFNIITSIFHFNIIFFFRGWRRRSVMKWWKRLEFWLKRFVFSYLLFSKKNKRCLFVILMYSSFHRQRPVWGTKGKRLWMRWRRRKRCCGHPPPIYICIYIYNGLVDHWFHLTPG